MAVKAHYSCLALLFLLGIQLAACKSVDETFKDDFYNARTLSLSKRDVDEENSEAETVTLSSEENSESDNDEETTPILVTSTPKPMKKRKPIIKKKTTTTTTEAIEDEPTTSSPEDDEEIQEEEVASTVKPLTTNNPKLKNRKKVKPATDLPIISDRINSEEEEMPKAGPHFPKQPATNLLPPMPSYPQHYNGYLNPMQTQASAPWGFNPIYSSPSTGYNYPRPIGPAFSDSKVGPGTGTLGVGNGFASASASASGSGDTVSTSTSPGNGYQHSPNSFNTRSGLIPTGGSRPNSGSFVNLRGSFPASDGESVAIEVNGPVSSGSPAYEPTYTGTGTSYAGSDSFVPNSYMNTAPNYGGTINPSDLQAFFQQYFAALQAQQQAFQQQLQAQIEAQRQAGGAFASSSAFITNDQGEVDPKAQVNVNTYTSSKDASPSTFANSRSGLGSSISNLTPAKIEHHNSIWEQSNQVDSNFGAYGNSNGLPQSAYAGASLGSNGGFQSAHVSPAAPGIFSRFAEEVPPPSGKHFGVFSSSSSSSATGPDGKQISHKSATVGVNDNGKVTYKTVHDP